MFTGLIQSKATLKTITKKGSGKEMTIQIDDPLFEDIKVDDSISISGVCSTAPALDSEESAISVDITDDTFSVHLIPHTIENTTLKEKSVNDGVNLEFDQYAKYIYRFHQLQG